MTRNRASAKQAGSKFARLISDWFRAHGHPFADKAPLAGSKDKGDVANVLHSDGQPIALELKDRATLALPEWWREAETEAANLGTPYAAIIHKRRGVTDPSQQWCVMDVAMFNRIIRGEQA